MTTETRPAETEVMCVLRRGKLDERDRLICAAVWDFYEQHGYSPCLRWIECETGVSLSIIHSRLSGLHSDGSIRRGFGLAKNGWLRVANGKRSLRPGPRFVALEKSHGERWPLEWAR